MNIEKKTLNIRPKIKFDPSKVEKMIRDIVNKNMEGKVYDHIYAADWTKQMTRQVHDKLKELPLERYKFAVQVIIGEDNGVGLKSICGCILDDETDGKVVTLFTGETLYCVVAVFAVYCYRYV